jgi:hypothetical protein
MNIENINESSNGMMLLADLRAQFGKFLMAFKATVCATLAGYYHQFHFLTKTLCIGCAPHIQVEDLPRLPSLESKSASQGRHCDVHEGRGSREYPSAESGLARLSFSDS